MRSCSDQRPSELEPSTNGRSVVGLLHLRRKCRDVAAAFPADEASREGGVFTRALHGVHVHIPARNVAFVGKMLRGDLWNGTGRQVAGVRDLMGAYCAVHSADGFHVSIFQELPVQDDSLECRDLIISKSEGYRRTLLNSNAKENSTTTMWRDISLY